MTVELPCKQNPPSKQEVLSAHATLALLRSRADTGCATVIHNALHAYSQFIFPLTPLRPVNFLKIKEIVFRHEADIGEKPACYKHGCARHIVDFIGRLHRGCSIHSALKTMRSTEPAVQKPTECLNYQWSIVVTNLASTYADHRITLADVHHGRECGAIDNRVIVQHPDVGAVNLSERITDPDITAP